MFELSPVPVVGLSTDLIRDQQVILTIKPGQLGDVDMVHLDDGTPIIRIERDLMSDVSLMSFINVKTNQLLFQMQKDKSKTAYFAEDPNGTGQHLFDINIQASLVGGATAVMDFPNTASDGSMTQFKFKNSASKANTITWQGLPVAEVEQGASAKDRKIQLAARVDPLPALLMSLAMTDAARKKTGRFSGIGAGGGFTKVGQWALMGLGGGN